MADWEKGYLVDYSETGDTTAEAFGKHINELSDLYGYLNDLKSLRTSGLVEHEGGIVTLNTDITKIDITACTYWLSGDNYTYAGGTVLTPTIESGDSSFFVGLDSTGLIYSGTTWSDVQKETIIPLCRLQATQGQSGPGSDLEPPIDQRYIIGEDGFHRRLWHEQAIGALYHKGGEITNSATAFQISQNAGIFFTKSGVQKTISASSNLEASVLKHISGSWDLATRATLVIPKYWDDGTDQVALGNNKWASHTLLKSPKEDDLFIMVMSPAEYDSEAEAQSAGIYYGLFVNAYSSDFMSVAHLLIKGSGTDVIIEDHRPLIGENAGAVIGTATMQQIYDNSSEPEILTDGTRGALSLKRGSTADTDYVFEVLNGAGVRKFAITGNGAIVSAHPLGYKNLFTNGTLLSWQEGVPTGITNSLTYFADVFATNATSGTSATLDVSQQKTSLNSESARITASVASTDLTGVNFVYGFLAKQFELQNFAHLKDKEITLQFKFKASEIGNYAISFYDAAVAESYVTTFNYTTADTEQLVTFTINLDSTKLDFTIADNAMLFGVYIGLDNNGDYEIADASKDSWQTGFYGTTDACVNWSTTLNAYIQVGDIQIEEGTEATAVERPDVVSNLVRCQRYYQYRNSLYSSSYTNAGGGNRLNHIGFSNSMRDTPSISFSSITYTNSSVLLAGQLNKDGFNSQITATTAGKIAVEFSYITDARL